MAKVYLFRKITESTEQQANTYDEAVSSMVQQVLSGATGIIFNYDEHSCSPDVSGDADTTCSIFHKDSILSDIFGGIFQNVYSMELNMEINISIRCTELDKELQRILLVENNYNRAGVSAAAGDEELDYIRNRKDHFVSSPSEVFAYMENTIRRLVKQQDPLLKHFFFTLLVRQSDAESSNKLLGKLNILQLSSSAIKETSLDSPGTPLRALLRIIESLAKNDKTHVRYYNIRLARVLKDLLGSSSTIVLLNFGAIKSQRIKEISEHAKCESQLPAVFWRMLYRRERKKYQGLRERVLNLEFYGSNAEKDQLDELIDSLDERNEDVELNNQVNSYNLKELDKNGLRHRHMENQIYLLYGELNEKDRELQRNFKMCRRIDQRCDRHEQLFQEQSELQMEMEEIKIEAELALEDKAGLHPILKQLIEERDYHTQQLVQKDQLLVQQRAVFRDKLSEYCDLFNKLWNQQAKAMQNLEIQREKELSELFDTLYTEIRCAHETQLAKLKQETEEKEQELLRLQQQDS